MKHSGDLLRRRGRWLRELWPDRNPLRRTSDRAAAAVVALTLVAFLVGAPLVTLFAAHWAGTAAARLQKAQWSSFRQVPAVLLTTSHHAVRLDSEGLPQPEMRARWVAPDGQVQTGLVPVPAGALAGHTVRVWVDRTGQLTSPPLRDYQVVGQVVFAAVVSPVALAGFLLTAAAVAIHRLNRRRLAAWAADWQVTAPRWTSRR